MVGLLAGGLKGDCDGTSDDVLVGVAIEGVRETGVVVADVG